MRNSSDKGICLVSVWWRSVFILCLCKLDYEFLFVVISYRNTRRHTAENHNIHNLVLIFTFCWPCTSVYLSQYLTNLMHNICYTISFFSCLYMFRAHVLETCRGMKKKLSCNKCCASSWLNTEINLVLMFV